MLSSAGASEAFSRFRSSRHVIRLSGRAGRRSARRTAAILSIATLMLAVMLNATALAAAEPATFVYLHLDRARTGALEPASLREARRSHFDNIGRLGRQGRLRLAGPLGNGDGIFILATTSPGEALRWLQEDASIAQGLFRPEIIVGEVVHGRLCRAREPIAMIPMQFEIASPTDPDAAPGHSRARLVFRGGNRSFLLLSGPPPSSAAGAGDAPAGRLALYLPDGVLC